MGHTFTQLHVHVIFSTKGRRPTIGASFRDRLYEYMAGVARHEFGHAIRIGGTENHVHGLLSWRTSVSVADGMKKWKSLSSGWAHKTFPDSADFGWQTGYGAFSVSHSALDRVARYIENQEAHHRTQSFEEEFIAFLERHQVDYDPQRIWD